MASKKPDYEFKSYLLKTGLYKDYKKALFDTYWYGLLDKDYNKKINTYSNPADAYHFLEGFSSSLPNEYKECFRMNHAERNRSLRLNNKIKDIIYNGKSLFLTLTFTDDVLSSTSEITRRRYVARWLKSNCIKYVANIDYGKKNGREHYHAVVLVNDNINYKSWSYGALNGKIINNCTNSTSYILKNYINKLVNHALKDTAKQVRLIYSRNVK